MSKCYRFKVLPCMLMLCYWNMAFGQQFPQEHCRVSIQRSIIDTLCAIATTARELSINMGVATTGAQLLDYTLRLIGNHQQQDDGEYHTILRFKMIISNNV